MNQQQNILQIENLSKYFGGLAAVSDCSLKIKKGSITGIIGPNGSGKTTLIYLAALISKASLFIGVDSVASHIAAAVDTPSITLFGPSNVSNWRPWSDKAIVISRTNNEEICNEYVKTNKVKGFSIEGYFADKMQAPKENVEEQLSEELLSKIKNILNEK